MTAEATAIVMELLNGPRERLSLAQAIRLVADRLVNLVRSARLQDARAGCDWCARKEAAPEKRDGWRGWWHAGKTKGSQRAFFKCERPEVWDALSLLPPK